MKRIGFFGDIGSGKTYVAKCFGYPVFNADLEVAKIYKNNRKVSQKLKKELPDYFNSFPVKKKEIINAILSNRKNLKKIIKIWSKIKFISADICFIIPLNMKYS